MRFFGLKTCDTCRRALTNLRAAGHTPQVIDVRADGVGDQDLSRFIAAFGPDLINRRSTTWRGLSKEESSADTRSLLQSHPTLMKRPVIEDADGALYLGWTAKVQDALS